jgi:Fanconi anemia group M protein
MRISSIFLKKQNKKAKLRIIADHRENNSLVISELIERGIEVELRHLKVADFIVKDVAIERKTISDFISSMINKRLTRQLEEIKQYKKCFLIIEGMDEHELYNDHPEGVSGNAIRGFLLDILLKYKVPIIFTKNYEDTAKFLIILAKKQKREISVRANKKARSKKEQLQYILEGFPGIGPKTSKKLLKKYKTLKNILNQDIEELKKEIGKKAEIFRLLKEKY